MSQDKGQSALNKAEMLALLVFAGVIAAAFIMAIVASFIGRNGVFGD